MRGLMGTFALMPPQELVELLARRKATGSVTCERGTVRKTLHVIDGVAVGAASNDPREYLGQLLINFGHIDDEQLAKAFRTQEETKIRLGKVLMLVGVVGSETIRETLAIKIRETILDAFLWDSGVFHVDDVRPPPPDELDAQVPLTDIAREAEFRTTAWGVFRAQFPTGAATLHVHEERIPAEVAAAELDATLLRLAREGKTIDEIGVALRATDFQLYQRLYALKQRGIVEAAAPVDASPAPGDAIAQARALVTAARAALATGDATRAEEAAVRAAELAPTLEGCEAVLADARAQLAARLRLELLHGTRRPRLKVALHDVELMRLAAADKYLLLRCDGARDLADIARLAPLPELDVLKAVHRFVGERLVELA